MATSRKKEASQQAAGPAPQVSASPEQEAIAASIREIAESTGEQIESVTMGDHGECVIALKPRGDEKYIEPLRLMIGFAAERVGNADHLLAELREQLRDQFADMRLYAAGAHPDQQEDQGRTTTISCVTANVTDLGRARELPEFRDAEVRPDVVVHAAGSIERFADADGRTMEIVAIAGVLHKRAVHDEQPDDITEEA